MTRRGLMVDCARLPVRHAVYGELLPWLREWGYDLLQLHLTDDQGCALHFPSAAEAASVGAWTPRWLRRFADRAAAHGIEVIAELETLGHTRFLTDHPRWRHLAGDLPATHAEYHAIDPDHPQTLPVLAGLIADLRAILPSPLVHIGLDECDLRTLPRYREAPAEELAAAFARHAAAVCDLVITQGGRPLLWADHLAQWPASRAALPRTAIPVDWRYEAVPDAAPVQTLIADGFQPWLAPSIMWWGNHVVTDRASFANVAACAELARRHDAIGGLLVTAWCPWRHLPGALDWPIAWAGRCLHGAVDAAFARTFCTDFYGLPAHHAAAVAHALDLMHDQAPDRTAFRAPRASMTQVHAFATAAQQLQTAVSSATRHRHRLGDVALTARLLQRWAERTQGAPPMVDRALRSALRSAWDRGYHRRRARHWGDHLLELADALDRPTDAASDKGR